MNTARIAILSSSITACTVSMTFLGVRHGGPIAISSTALGITTACVVVSLALLLTLGVKR